MARFPRRFRFLAYSGAAAVIFAAALLSVDPLARAVYRLPDNTATVETLNNQLETSAASSLPASEDAEIVADSDWDSAPFPRDYYGPYGWIIKVHQPRGQSNNTGFELPQILLPALELPKADLALRSLPQISESSLSVPQRSEDAGVNPLGPFKVIFPAHPSNGSELTGSVSPSLPQVSVPGLPAAGPLRR